MALEYEEWLKFLAACHPTDGTGTAPAAIAEMRGKPVEPAEIAARRRVYDFLSRQKALYIAVDDALNFGHQASAATLAQSLDELGYKGPFTFIAPETIKEKVDRVVPGRLRDRIRFAAAPDFEPTHEYDRPAVSGIEGLVMVAATDRVNEETGAAFLKYLGPDDVIVLKPYAWPHSARLVLRKKGEPISLSDLPEFSVYQFSIAPISLNDLEREAKELAAVLRAAASNAAVLIPIYGLHRLEDDHRVSAYATFVSAVRKAYREAKVVLLEIGTTRFPPAPPPEDIETLPLSGNVPDKIRSLKAGQVLSVTIPSVSQDAFRTIYRTGAAPRMLEGANTANYVQLLGLPYITPRDSDTPYPRLESGFVPNGGLDVDSCLRQLNAVTVALSKGTDWSQALAENEIYKEKFYPARTALSTVTSDLRFSRPSRVPTLDAESIIRLKKVTDLPLESVVGQDAADKATKAVEQYKKKMMTEDISPPDVLVLDEKQVATLKENLEKLISRYGEEIHDALAGISNRPTEGAVTPVQAALTAMSQVGGSLNKYFQAVKAQSNDYGYNQVLRALDAYIKRR